MQLITKNLYLCHMIVTDDKDEKIEDLYRKHHAISVVNQVCHGTVNQRILNIIGISNSHRKYLHGVFTEKRLQEFITEVNGLYNLSEPGHGILFVTKLRNVALDGYLTEKIYKEKNMTNEVLITVITNYGTTDELIYAARAAGARGATIMKGHGTVSEEAQRFFGVAIEPEKEIIKLIVKKELEETVMRAIYDNGNFKESGNGIVFSQEINKSLGISC